MSRKRFPLNISDLNSDVFGFLPRRKKDGEEYFSCDALKSNKGYYMIFPGLEGIPTNIFINSFITSIILITMALVLWYSHKRKKREDNIYSNENQFKYIQKTNWFRFIFGKRKANENMFFSNKEINREHPNAYLPIFMHYYQDLMKEGSKTREISLYRQKSIDDNLENGSDYVESPETSNNSSNGQTLKTNSEELKTSVRLEKTNSVVSNVPTLRSISDTSRTEEESEMDKLTFLLWDEDRDVDSNPMTTRYESEVPENVKSFWKWISKYFFIKDVDILKKSGPDGLQYLLFQRYLIYFLLCLTIICLLVILPTNLSGNKLNNKKSADFKKTTFINIEKSSRLVYIHTLMTLIVIAMGHFLMHSFRKIIYRKEINIDKKVLLIENIPESQRNTKNLKMFFENKFPKVIVKRITFVYNTDQIMSLLLRLYTSISAKHYCIEYLKKYGQRCEVRPYPLGNFLGICGCCQWFPKVDGIRYYDRNKNEIETKIRQEINIVISQPQNKAFVKFNTKDMAKEVYDHYNHCYSHCYPLSKLFRWVFGHQSDPLDSWQWFVSYAPIPDDIDWSYISMPEMKGWILTIIINALIIIIFIFFSTPTSAYNMVKLFIPVLNQRNITIPTTPIQKVKIDKLASIFWVYIPTIILMLMTATLPLLIRILTLLIPYKTKSNVNYSIMYKSFLYLLLMVMILPSLEFISSYTLIRSSVKIKGSFLIKEETKPIEINCIFRVENGAYFVNYILTSSLVGSAIEITRIPELFFYIMGLLFVSRNSAEYLSARQSTTFEFNFGTFYPRMLLIFTLVVTFSISCPIIAPVGLFFMTIRHLVDRYLIHHVYIPSKINQRMHSKATFFVFIALFFLLFQVFSQCTSNEDQIPAKLLGAITCLYFVFLIYEFFRDFFNLS